MDLPVDHLLDATPLALFRATKIIFQSLLLVIAGATQKELARQFKYLKVEAEIFQTAIVAPVGLLGLAYWYALHPMHQALFSSMLKAIARAACGGSNMASIQVGDRAPDFTLSAQTGAQVSLAGFQGQKAVVLFFYPKDGTAVCTREACGFRDAYEDFLQAGAVVVGVSSDSRESHQAFAGAQRLPFLLLADADGALRKAFGVPKTLGFLPGRVTYVIDKEGVVRHIFSAQFSADRHVSEALAVVRQLAAS